MTYPDSKQRFIELKKLTEQTLASGRNGFVYAVAAERLAEREQLSLSEEEKTEFRQIYLRAATAFGALHKEIAIVTIDRNPAEANKAYSYGEKVIAMAKSFQQKFSSPAVGA